MHLSVPQVEVDVVVGQHAGELFRDASKLEDRSRVHRRRFYASGNGERG